MRENGEREIDYSTFFFRFFFLSGSLLSLRRFTIDKQTTLTLYITLSSFQSVSQSVSQSSAAAAAAAAAATSIVLQRKRDRGYRGGESFSSSFYALKKWDF